MSPEDPILKQAGLNIARKLAEKYRSIDALSRVPMGDCQQGLGLLTELFEHIDAQEKQIRDLVADDDLMANCNSLRDRCWKAEAQIAALKEKLLEKQCQLMPAAPGCYADARMEAARQQLAKEMPEVEW